MKRTISVARGKDLVDVRVTNHSRVVLYDASGDEWFRSQSKGKHITAMVIPGRYTIETDGKFVKIAQLRLEPELRTPKVEDMRKVPSLKRMKHPKKIKAR